jgi:MYXO-CTERM domain-containing protein
VFGVVCLAPSIAEACTCAEPPSVRKALKESQIVFEGTVVDSTTIPCDDGWELKRSELEVIEAWKGVELGETVELWGRHHSENTTCGYGVSDEMSYILYVSERDLGSFTGCAEELPETVLAVSDCSRSLESDDEDAEFERSELNRLAGCTCRASFGATDWSAGLLGLLLPLVRRRRLIGAR